MKSVLHKCDVSPGSDILCGAAKSMWSPNIKKTTNNKRRTKQTLQAVLHTRVCHFRNTLNYCISQWKSIVYRNGDCLSRNPLPISQKLDSYCFIVGAITSSVHSEEEDESLAMKQKACRNWNRLIVELQNDKSRVKNFLIYNGKLYKETFSNGNSTEDCAHPSTTVREFFKHNMTTLCLVTLASTVRYTRFVIVSFGRRWPST